MNQPLAEGIFWIAVLACVVAQIAILRSTYAARKVERSALVPAASRAGEIVWAVVPVVALSVLLVATWQRIQARDAHMMMMMGHSGMPMPGMASPSAER
jgi:heme/copper-type cytochrome/quinol oxidase subunit 2